jgi:HD-GYP domain-containing protein (c-di-GMP phosphodiesterase class II)
MAGRSAMSQISAPDSATDGHAPHAKWTINLPSTAVFAALLLVPALAAGFAITRLLGGEIRGMFAGISLGVVYIGVVVLMRDRLSHRLNSGPAQHAQDLRASYDSIVSVLCAALDLRDNVTTGHARRLSEIASVVAWQMGLRKEQLRQIEKAAILHDIGKIGVADAVLSKAGPLDDSEWTEMKRHPELGYQILSRIDFLRDAADVVFAHHERHDGDGYPRGLKGAEIPIGAQIFAVADAYDAMTTHRPYRRAFPHRRAVDEIVRNAGTQFDPDVVRAFLEAERRGLLGDSLRVGAPEIDVNERSKKTAVRTVRD